MKNTHHLLTPLACLFAAALLVIGCDSLPPAPELDEALVTEAPTAQDRQALIETFQAVERLFAIGWNGASLTATAVDTGTPIHAAVPLIANATADTTLNTGYQDALGRGYLVTLTYREPQGVPLWQLRLQHGTFLEGQPSDPASVETITLTFITRDDLSDWVERLIAGNVPFLQDHSDPEGSFAEAESWRVGRIAGSPDGAVFNYADQGRRTALTVRDPIITINANGSATVRDGLEDGEVRTRYYLADVVIDSDGTIVEGTLDRTLLNFGEPTSGAIVSRTEFADGSVRQTRQWGGDGVVFRENTTE